MYGDKNGASIPDLEEAKKMTASEKKKSFIFKNVYQRIAIVIAGPVANFLLAILLLTFLFSANGLNTVLPVIDEVMPDSSALAAGLKKGDEILAINEKEINDFSEIRQTISTKVNHELTFTIKRGEEVFDLKIAQKYKVSKDFFGDEVKTPLLGISASKVDHQDLNIGQSFIQAHIETYKISIAIFKAIWELLSGQRSVDELGGPIKIAKYSGQTTSMGIIVVVWFMAMISINLGVMNLLPVPVLDGGHLFYYIIELIRKKPLPQKAQMIGFQIGMSLVLALMLFTTFNDIRHLIK